MITHAQKLMVGAAAVFGALGGFGGAMKGWGQVEHKVDEFIVAAKSLKDTLDSQEPRLQIVEELIAAEIARNDDQERQYRQLGRWINRNYAEESEPR